MRFLLILYVITSFGITLQVQSGQIQDTRLLVGDRGKDGILLFDGNTGAFRDAWELSPTGGLSSPRDLTFGADGHLYVSSGSTNGVLRYDGQTGAFIDAFISPGGGGLNFPQELIFGPDGHLYIKSTSDDMIPFDSILRYDRRTGAFIDVVVSALFDFLSDLTFGPDGHLYVSFSDRIERYDVQTGDFLDVFVAEARSLAGLSFGPDGHLYASHSEGHRILRYDGRTGALMDTFVPSRRGGLEDPADLIFGPNGDLYVNSARTNSIFRYDGRTGAFMGAFVPNDDPSSSQSITFGPDGNLYVSHSSDDRILRYDGRTGAFIGDFVSKGDAGLDNPGTLTIGPDGDLYVASLRNDSVLRYDGRTGAFIEIFVPSVGRDLDDSLSGLTFGPDGDLYVSSDRFDNGSILRYDGRTGTFIGDFVTPGRGGLDNPRDPIFGPDQHLYVISSGRILRYNGRTGAFIDTFVPSGSGELTNPSCMTFGPDGDLYVCSALIISHLSLVEVSVLRYDGRTGNFMDTFVSPDNSTFAFPGDLTFGPDGHLYMSSIGGHRILRFNGQTGEFIDNLVSFEDGLTFPTGLAFQTLNQPSHPLIVVQDGNGIGDVVSTPTGIDCGDTCSHDFREGDEIALTAVPAPNQVFAGWRGGGCSGTGSCTVTVTQPLTLTAAFEPQPPPDRFLLAIVRQGRGTGAVTDDSNIINCAPTCTAEFLDGTSITLRAMPDAGTVFAGWGGQGCSGLDACTVSMDQPRTLTATFEPQPQVPTFALSVTKAGEGSGRITSDAGLIDCGSTCRANVTEGMSVTLRPEPDADSIFVGWQGGDCSGAGPCTVTLTDALSLTATFQPRPPPNRFRLTIVKRGNGAGIVTDIFETINCGANCSAEFLEGQSVSLGATAASDSVFVDWDGEGCSGMIDCAVTMDQSRTVSAEFELIPQINTFTLSVLKAGTGSGRVISTAGRIDCGTRCGVDVTDGTTLTLSAVPDANSTFAGWQDGSCAGVSACTLTIKQMQRVTARFDRVRLSRTLTVQKQGGGVGTIDSKPAGINCGPNCTADFEDNTVVTLTLREGLDSNFVGWVGGLCLGNGPCKLTMTEDRLLPALVTPANPPPGE